MHIRNYILEVDCKPVKGLYACGKARLFEAIVMLGAWEFSLPVLYKNKVFLKEEMKACILIYF